MPRQDAHAITNRIVNTRREEFLSDGLEPAYDGFGIPSELGGVFLCEYGEELGIGKGIPGKIGKDFNMNPNSFDLGFDRGESASVVGFTRI